MEADGVGPQWQHSAGYPWSRRISRDPNHTLYDHASLKTGWGASRERYGPNHALRGQKSCNATVWEIAGLDAGLRSKI